VSPLGEEAAGGLVHLLTGNLGPTQEVTDDLVDKVKPLRAVEAS